MSNHPCSTCNNAGRIEPGDGVTVFCNCAAGHDERDREWRAHLADQRATEAIDEWMVVVARLRRQPMLRAA